MKTSKKYVEIWEKHLPTMLNLLDKVAADKQPREFKTSSNEFEAVGNRLASGYSFIIKFKNGKVVNNLKGSAVARDLRDVLDNSKMAKLLLQGKNISIRHTKNFELIVIYGN